MKIGEVLKDLRKQAHLTQAQMATGVMSQSTYSRIEHNKNKVDAQELIDLLSIHNLNIGEFLNLVDKDVNKNEYKFQQLKQKLKLAKTIEEVDKIAQQIKDIGGVEKHAVDFEIEHATACARITHSNKNVSAKVKNKVKKLLPADNWNPLSYRYLSEKIFVLDIVDAYKLTMQAFDHYQKYNSSNLVILELVAKIGANFLKCADYQNVNFLMVYKKRYKASFTNSEKNVIKKLILRIKRKDG